MKLTYRGINYEYEPVVIETESTEVAGKFRGRDWRFRNLKKSPVIMPTNGLTYRGVSYSKPGTVTTETTANQEVAGVSIQDKARSLMLNHGRNIKKRQQSMLTRTAATVGLDEKASTYWNRIQGKIHPTFRLSYDRVGATMS
jgi:Domain of unknown function (DUF4278)